MAFSNILWLSILFISLGIAKASLRDIFSSAMAEVRQIIFAPEDDEESKIWNIIDDAYFILGNLTKELDRLGKNAYLSAVSSKELSFQEKASSCASKKGSIANGLFKIKRQQLKKCHNASASLVYDLAESFIKSNQPPEGSDVKCKEERECIELAASASSMSETYETWGSRLSAVHRCTQNTIRQTTNEYMLVFKHLRQECLSNDFVLRKRIASVVPPVNMSKKVKIPRPRSKKDLVSKVSPK